jgi:hypothetical protein
MIIYFSGRSAADVIPEFLLRDSKDVPDVMLSYFDNRDNLSTRMQHYLKYHKKWKKKGRRNGKNK